MVFIWKKAPLILCPFGIKPLGVLHSTNIINIQSSNIESVCSAGFMNQLVWQLITHLIKPTRGGRIRHSRSLHLRTDYNIPERTNTHM